MRIFAPYPLRRRIKSKNGVQKFPECSVTATKRAESAQDVPISVQAVTGDDLRELRVETFGWYVEYLPNVVGTGNGPGRKELYIRGSATEQSGIAEGGCRPTRASSTRPPRR